VPDVTRDEEALVAAALRAVVRRAGLRGYLVGAVVRLLRGGVHELDLTVPAPVAVVAARADTALSGTFGDPVRSPGRVRGLVAAARGGVPVVVTVDLAPDPAGGTAVRVRAAVKAVVSAQRAAEQAARAVADRLATDEHPTAGHPGDQLGAHRPSAAGDQLSDQLTDQPSGGFHDQLTDEGHHTDRPSARRDDQQNPTDEHPSDEQHHTDQPSARPDDQLGDPGDTPGEQPAGQGCWFVVDPEDAAELSAAELGFAAGLRARSAGWAPADVDGFVVGRAADGVTEPLIACAHLIDPDEPDRLLVSVGVHLLGDRVRGDRLHSQVHGLPARPSSWALDVTGDRDELVAAAAEWFRAVLAKPVVLYVWLRGDRAYAGRYAFADTDETLVQLYTRELAPPGQAEELIAAGHVHGRGWIQTTGLPTPSGFVHVRGDLAAGSVPAGVPVVRRRGPFPGLWYEGGVTW
jgi:hypothetical protein